jgi:hypothetical protein
MSAIVPLPENLNIVHDRGTFIIRRRWFSAAAWLLVFFALFWNGFMVVWMSIALSQGQWMMAAFGSIHACVGLGLIYFCVASFINKTDVSVDSNYLGVQHYPMPWLGSKKVRVHDISQLYCKEHITRSKNRTNVSYRVHAVMNNGRDQKLISGLTTDTQARFIEHEIESVLGLENLEVAGELRS